jgi:hypothetical protein
VYDRKECDSVGERGGKRNPATRTVHSFIFVNGGGQVNEESKLLPFAALKIFHARPPIHHGSDMAGWLDYMAVELVCVCATTNKRQKSREREKVTATFKTLLGLLCVSGLDQNLPIDKET